MADDQAGQSEGGGKNRSGLFSNINRRQEETTRIRKSEFLPTISLGRRLMELEGEEITKATNPFKLEANTERVLAYGERARELESLNQHKYELVQKIADNKHYVDNLSRKRLHINGDRTGLISDVRQITKIPHLAPHIATKKTGSPSQRKSHELSDSVKKKLGPIATRSRSIQPPARGGRNGG